MFYLQLDRFLLGSVSDDTLTKHSYCCYLSLNCTLKCSQCHKSFILFSLYKCFILSFICNLCGKNWANNIKSL